MKFSYEPDRPILQGLSFEVPAGKTVAVVGPSGAGKSTLSRLIYRLYDVGEGRITIDGQDIADVTQNSLRAAIGMVPQDTVLFNDTIRYNIRYGRWEASDAEVEEAARLAQIDGFIRMSPKGYETEVGERGLEAVGRREAARGDRPHHSRRVRRSFCWTRRPRRSTAIPRRKSRTRWSGSRRTARSLVIAHRLSTIVNADEIIVLEPGPHRRARHPCAAACGRRPLRQHVEQAARGRGCA